MFAALRHRDFRWLWAGTFCSTAGQWIQNATLGWVTYDLTGSGTLLGAVLGVRAIPMLLLAPLAGVVADRHDRRHALATAQLLMAVVSFVLAAVLALQVVQVWHLFAFTLCAGASAAFDRTLRNTLVFDVVPRAEVANAVALNTIAFSSSRTLGPGVAGLLIAWVGPAWNFGIQGVLYAGVAAAVLMVSAPRRSQRSVNHNSAWREMQAGLRFAVTDPVARMMVLLGMLPPILLIPSFSALMPVFAVRVFMTGPDGLGLLLSAVGAGGILGGVIAASVSRYDRIGLLQIGALLAFALSLVGFALSPGFAAALMFLMVAGAAEMVLATSNVTALQMCAPQEMRGRIASLLTVFPALISVGALTSGMGADLLGPQMLVVLLAAIAICLTTAIWINSATIRTLRLSKLVAT
jgi:MFS family permease